MNRIPTTRYSWMIVALAAGALIVEALDIGSLSIILPVVRKVMALTPAQVGILAAASALGIAIGMIPAGYLADRFGRKRLLVAGTIWFAGATAIAALSPNFAVLTLLRGLAGLGMAPAFIMPFSIVSEFVSPTSRAAFASVLETALGIGYLLPPILGLLIMPVLSPDVAWRVFLAVAGLPLIYVWVIWKHLPESPRWLSRVGRHEEAEAILGQIEARVEKIVGAPLRAPDVLRDEEFPASTGSRALTWNRLAMVWRAPYRGRTVAMICGAAGTFSMFYLGVNYIPSLFVERHIALTNAFLFTLVVAAAQIPGKILNGILAEYIGRKPVYILYTALAAVGCYLFGRASEPLAMVGWGSLILFAAAGSAPAYKMWYAEQYPTPVRATGQATVEGIGGRLCGGVIWTSLFPILVASVGIQTTMSIVAVLGVAALSVVALFGAETYRRSIEALEVEALARG